MLSENVNVNDNDVDNNIINEFKILTQLKRIKTDYDISNFINKLAMSN
jgi:hypothetical protein